MAGIPTLQESQPVLTPVQVNSGAEGYEAFAKTLGSLAQSAGEKTVEMAKDQSQAQLMTSSAQSETIKTNAQIEMIKHPDQAENILGHVASSLDKLNQEAFVNDADRRKLAFLNSQDFNQLRLKAATTSFGESQKAASLAFWDSYPVTNKQIQDALDTGDLKKAEMLENNLHNTALGLARTGSISPEQYASIRKINYELYSRTEDLMKMSQNPNGHSAADFHAAVASPFESGNFGNVGYPTDANTAWMANHYNSDRSFSGQLTSLYNDQPISWGVVAGSTDDQYNEFKQQMIGVNTVKGAINANSSLAQIDAHIKALEAQPKLTNIQQGQVNYWKSFQNRLKADNGYYQVMGGTTLGGRLTQDYNNESVAIMNSAKTPQEKSDAIRDNDNNYIGKMISLGQSMMLDHDLIKPIPAPWVQDVQTAFNKDAPVTGAIARLSYVKPQYRAYLADAMKKPEQAMAVFLSGETLGKADTTFQAQLIEANQDRDYSSLLKTGKNETKDVNVWDDISSDSSMKGLYYYLGRLPGGTETQGGLRKAAVNYVLYRAAKEGDVNLNGKANYERDFVNNVSKGFNIVDGGRYLFNGSSLNLRKPDMDYIADYALSQAYQHIHAGRTEEEFQTYVDLNPLHATNTPDGRIVVIDKAGHAAVDNQGHSAFDQPYTNNMLNAAHENAANIEKEMKKYYGVGENLRRSQRLHPGFPFAIETESQKLVPKESIQLSTEKGEGI